MSHQHADCVSKDSLAEAQARTVSDYRIICPRECVSPKTEHCIGTVHEDAGGVRCDFCGRYMPLDEAIQFPEEA